ncbi:MAG: 50S ribosomal protein L16 [Candidatus Aenigmarchaeota archaeon]|nr:50S ribosomal protein L16 [Candidatus Aenigmarchaeota archaeon]
MSLRPARCYRTVHRPYTRMSTTKPRKSYVKGVAKPKVQQYQSRGVRPENFPEVYHLVSQANVQIRENSLEAARMLVVRSLEKNIGPAGFFFRLRVYPHHVLRENPLATGAGADRFQQGMRQSFGKPIGVAAQVKKGQTIMEVRVAKNHAQFARKSLNGARYKLPVKCKVAAAQTL